MTFFFQFERPVRKITEMYKVGFVRLYLEGLRNRTVNSDAHNVMPMHSNLRTLIKGILSGIFRNWSRGETLFSSFEYFFPA